MGNCCKRKSSDDSNERGRLSHIVEDPNSPVKFIHDKDEFSDRLKEADGKLVVVDFFAQWCGPCKMLSPKITELSKQEPRVMFLKVDVDENEDLAGRYNISCMPTFILIRGGNKVDEFSGANVEKLKELINKHKT